ncbi:MAG TPA: phosphoadenylyl-sulfate reductase [Methylocella sp.]|nr:phosphoadenylyl-sulfate reductase [Methylocella sp.]
MAASNGAGFNAQKIAAQLNAEMSGNESAALLRSVIVDLFPGRVALVSSFGADSAVLLHMAAEIDRSLPVIFIDTGVLFEETLAYKDRLVGQLGLSNVVSIRPEPSLLAAEDPEDFLWASNPDRCCEIRKVAPLAKALNGFDAWITGRKQFQGHLRSNLALFDFEADRVKVNPLAYWPAARIANYLNEFALPRHPLIAKNYLSIGCMPCTSPVKPGEDSRAGRWRGRGKVECGLHTLPLYAGADI